jgi:hypothetical protein
MVLIMNTNTTALSAKDLLENARKAIGYVAALDRGGIDRLVMTTTTWHALVDHFAKHNEGYGTPLFPDSIYGIPVETFHTLRECMDRMMELDLGSALLVCDGEIPLDLLSHPFMIKQRDAFFAKFNLKLGFDVA